MTAANPHPAIDWDTVRERLARAAAATEEALNPSPARTREIMDERARLIARAPPVAEQTEDRVELLVFSLAGERYGIETRHVREVVRLTTITPVPGVADFVAGITSVRGEILAVVDPRPGGAQTLQVPPSRLIICGDRRAELGVLADGADDVELVPRADIFDTSQSPRGRSFRRRLTKDALIILDGAILLGEELVLVNRTLNAAERRHGG